MESEPLPHALMAVQPVCPACLRSLDVYRDVMDRQIPAVTREVVCVCGWFGRTRLVMEQAINVPPPTVASDVERRLANLEAYAFGKHVQSPISYVVHTLTPSPEQPE